MRDGEPPKGAKPIAQVVDEPPAVPEDSLAFLRDLAAYYFAPIGEVMRLALPPLERETARELDGADASSIAGAGSPRGRCSG